MKFEVFKDWYVYRGDYPLITKNYKEMFEHLLFISEFDDLNEIYDYIPSDLYPISFEQWKYIFDKDPEEASMVYLPTKECEKTLTANGLTPKWPFETLPILKQEGDIKYYERYYEFKNLRFYNDGYLEDYLCLYGTIQDIFDLGKISGHYVVFATSIANPDIKLKIGHITYSLINDHTEKVNKYEPDEVDFVENYDYLIRHGYKGQINCDVDNIEYLQKKYGIEKIGDEWYTRSSMKKANLTN